MIKVVLQKRDNEIVAYRHGRGSPILRPVPGNTRPAVAARWSDEATAIAELESPDMLGCPVEIIA